MSQSLRDQLLGLGYAAPKPEPRQTPQDRDVATRGPKADVRPPRRPDGNGDPRRSKRNNDNPRTGANPAATPARRPDAQRPRGSHKPAQSRDAGPGARPDIDLGKAFALRAQREKDERIALERERQAAALRKREAKARVVELVSGHARNDAQADIARHFEYGGKIRRVHVTPDQLRAVNAGELGVVQLEGRYLLFDAALVAQVRELLPSVIALMVVPGAEADDPYADPRYRVPDDLVW